MEEGDYAALALPGGFHSHGFDEALDSRVHELARSIHGRGGVVATMCVGVLPVAEAGLLRGGTATTYPHSRFHDNPARLREFGCRPTPGPGEVGNRIISCAGPAESLEVAYRLPRCLIGPEAVAQVQRYMVHGAVDSQPIG